MKPGFINVWTTTDFAIKQLQKAINDPHNFGNSSINHGKNIIFEYTDPNPFKEFHIGHLFTNIIGESLARIYETTGATVKRANYQGDVGMHVAKSIWGMIKNMSEQHLTIEDLEQKSIQERVSFLGQSYAQGAEAYAEDEVAQTEMKQINAQVYLSAQNVLVKKYKWQPQVDYSPFVKESTYPLNHIEELYFKGRSWSLEYFEIIYKRLGTTFDFYYFESFVGEYGVQTVREFLQKGIFEESNGAVIFPGEQYNLHTRVFINSLGLPTYEAKELGLAPTKYNDFKYDISVIITGNEINEYFKVLLAAMNATHPELGKRTKHFSHGMVKLPSGKMSSRTGKVITGEWLLDETQRQVQEIIDSNGKVPEREREMVSDNVALAAIKYSFLKSSIGKDVIFDFNESLSFEGNSGPYLQYTYARCSSVLEKSEQEHNSASVPTQLNKEESLLLRHMIKYPEIVQIAAEQFAPNLLCNYLFELAQHYNLFYQKHQILKADEETKAFRIQLTQAVASILNHGLNLLGIQTVEKM